MVIQLSKNVVIIRLKAELWQAKMCEGDGSQWEWIKVTDALSTDDMHCELIAMGFPQSDIALFVQAINNPDITPFNPKLNNKAKKAPARLGKTKNDMALSQEPVGIFNQAHKT